VPLPAPEPGLVVRYDYLWSRRAGLGADTADKTRPACILLTIAARDGETEVVLVPITHSAPGADDTAVEIPAPVKHALGLDAAPSWVIVTDANLDIWPSPDLQQLPRQPGRYHYGHLPPRLFTIIRDRFLEAYRARRVAVVRRADEG